MRLPIPAASTRVCCSACGQGFAAATVHRDPFVIVLVPDPRVSATPMAREIPPEIRSAFACLGIEPLFDLARVRTHYRRQIARHHPDKKAALGPDARRKAELKTRELIRAFEELRAFLAP